MVDIKVSTNRFGKAMQALCRAGRLPLRVVNLEKCGMGKGFRLGAERVNSIVLFGKTYETESRGLLGGLQKTRKVAKRVVFSGKANKKAA